MGNRQICSVIREATVDDIESLAYLAIQFYSASKFLSDFRLECFENTWNQLITSGMGVIFILEGEEGPAGALGGVAYPDINSGLLRATEFFWFVDPEHRGAGVGLYREFESWAKQKKCKEITMVHLVDSMPDKLERIYERLGFERSEVHYRKELF